MITVKVRPLFNLKRIIGSSELTLKLKEGSTIRDLIYVLVERYGDELEKLLLKGGDEGKRNIAIFVNGRLIDFIDGDATRLSDGDVVSMIPPAGGG
ncbi:MAG: MoaD family protein [Candidatus Nezhaarchaeales archaeon]